MALIDENGIAQTPDYASQLDSIARKRKIAQAMSAMSMEQRPMQSGWELGGQLAQALSAGFQNRALDKQSAEVNTGMNRDYANTTESAMQLLGAGDMAGASKILANSTDPRIAKLRETVIGAMLEQQTKGQENSGAPMRIEKPDGTFGVVQPRKVGAPLPIEMGGLPAEKLGESGGITFDPFTGKPRTALPVNQPRAEAARATAAAGAPQTSVYVPRAERTFADKIPADQVAQLSKGTEAGENFIKALPGLDAAEAVLGSKAGLYTGSFANARLAIAKGADLFGVGGRTEQEKITNSETYLRSMGGQVFPILQALRPASDTDVKIAQRMVGGDLTLSVGEMKRAVAAAKVAGQQLIKMHNTKLDRIKASAPGDTTLQTGLESYRIQTPPTREELLAEAKRRGLTK